MDIAQFDHPDGFTKEHTGEVRQGKRSEFGKNWSKFLIHLNEEQIMAAEASLRSMLELQNLVYSRLGRRVPLRGGETGRDCWVLQDARIQPPSIKVRL